MILSTTPQIEGHLIREYKGVVTGETIIGANVLNWCPWCLRFADFISKDTAISKLTRRELRVHPRRGYNPRWVGE